MRFWSLVHMAVGTSYRWHELTIQDSGHSLIRRSFVRLSMAGPCVYKVTRVIHSLNP